MSDERLAEEVMSEAYVAYHGRCWLKNAINSHQYGLRVKLKLCNEEDLKTFKDVKKHRKNRAGSGAYRVLTRMEGMEKWYGPVDMLFITWSHSPTNGVNVTFEMTDQDEWEKIRASQALDAGYEEGQLRKIEIMMIELDDEGRVVDIEQRAKMEKMALKRKWPKGGPRSKQAARLCQDHEFVRWVTQKIGVNGNGITPSDIAEWMRQESEIDSRAQLDHDEVALQRWEDRVHKPFLRSQM